jgi:DnaJ-class molecular chaperone
MDIPETVKCPQCLGTGKGADGKPCDLCNGTGQVPVEEVPAE